MKRGKKFNCKKGQLQMSFDMIVSVTLIIVFLAFAFYGINIFLKLQDSAKTASFIKKLQADVDTAWNSQQVSQEEEYILPSKFSMVCFADFSPGSQKRGSNAFVYEEIKKIYDGNENLFFYPVKYSGTESAEIKNIDLQRITSYENPFCIEILNGKVKLRLVKDFSDTLITIKR